MRNLWITILGGWLALAGCNPPEKPPRSPVTSLKDYQVYLTSEAHSDRLNQEIAFWSEKLESQPWAHTYALKTAKLLERRFKEQGRMEDLSSADSLLNMANQLVAGKDKVRIYQALARNAITRHQFKLARQHVEAAFALGQGRYGSAFMMFDVLIELGEYQQAEDWLAPYNSPDSFEYLIRAAKLKDHKGHLDSAIVTMELAQTLIEEKNNLELYCWTLSNLADMYGHAGRIGDSYNTYLKVLKEDPSYNYALKGIAWIAYSHDQHLSGAQQLFDSLLSRSDLPELYLIKAEIAALKGEGHKSKTLIDRFYQKASQSKFCGMYNNYMVKILSGEFRDYKKAIAIARKEVGNRRTPQSYDLLAWSYFQQGQIEKAAKILISKVEGQTFEPEVLYHMGTIFKSAGSHRKAKKYLLAAKESSFELGPVTTDKIEQLLRRG